MKRLVFLIIALAILTVPSSAYIESLNFQNPEDFTAHIACIGTGCSGATAPYWFQNASGGNSFIYRTTAADETYIISTPPANPMTYAAATSLTSLGACRIKLFDSSYNELVTLNGVANGNPTGAQRIEMKMIGGQAYAYTDGVETSHSGILAVNPSYVGFQIYQNGIDDIIWGVNDPSSTAPDKYIFDAPPRGYFLMKDFMNPAASGFYRQNTTTNTSPPDLVFSNRMPYRWSKGNGNNESLLLTNYGGGTYQTLYSGPYYSDYVHWDLLNFFSDSTNAPYGLYTETIPGSLHYSDTIFYTGSGGFIRFDRNSYAIGETATMDITITDGYYDTATYSYHVVIQDIFGNKIFDEPLSLPVSPHTGTMEYTWDDTDSEGVYYGLLYAKRLSNNEEILMNYDYAELTSNLIITGYVRNAQTTSVISGATVNITQGVSVDNLVTPVNGSYTTVSQFSANAGVTIEAGAAGYETYSHQFIPLYAGTLNINLTLMPTNPAHSGIAVGGIARTPPYNRTVDNAAVTVTNSSFGTYVVMTNAAGFYIKDLLPNNYWWNIWGSKSGFANSTIYQKLVIGS